MLKDGRIFIPQLKLKEMTGQPLPKKFSYSYTMRVNVSFMLLEPPCMRMSL